MQEKKEFRFLHLFSGNHEKFASNTKNFTKKLTLKKPKPFLQLAKKLNEIFANVLKKSNQKVHLAKKNSE